MIAKDSISIAGTVTAIGQNGGPGYGGGGGGAGGGILVAADHIDITGSVSVAPGSGGSGTSYNGGNGGKGRLKVLRGSSRTGAGTLTGVVTEGILPPLRISSTTHPDSTLVYNDDFQKMELSWERLLLRARVTTRR